MILKNKKIAVINSSFTNRDAASFISKAQREDKARSTRLQYLYKKESTLVCIQNIKFLKEYGISSQFIGILKANTHRMFFNVCLYI